MIGFFKIFSKTLIAILVCLKIQLNAQIILVNNPSNNLVAINPAFSAIYSPFNTNYVPKSICVSARVAQNQYDILTSGQYFFFKKNIGISANHNYVEQYGTNFQKVGLGLSYHLLFFNKISTGWGISVNYNDLKTDTATNFSIYNITKNYALNKSKYATLTFGNIINYNKLLIGFSIQPNSLILFDTKTKGSYYTSGSAQLKYSRPLTRSLNFIILYNAYWNSINNIYIFNKIADKTKFQSHTLNFHVAGKKKVIAGIGLRVSNFNYTSVIAKLGYSTRKIQFLYGAEPYFIGTKYSEIIHEFSIFFKFD